MLPHNSRVPLLIALAILSGAVGQNPAAGTDEAAAPPPTEAAPVQITDAVTTVTGTGDPAKDVPAVQAAVDRGGTVILKGTFEFGTDAGNHIIVPGRAGRAQDEKGKSTVFVHRSDVAILGETDERGDPLTTIRHGMPAFWIGWDGEVSRTQPPGARDVDFGIESLPQDSAGRVNYRDTGPEPGYLGPQTRYARAFPQVSATIQHIAFDSPLHYAAKATAGRNVAYIGNVVRNVQWGGLVHLNSYADATHIAAGLGALGAFYAPFLVPSVTGSLIFEGNRVENVGTEAIDPHGGECLGLIALLTNAAPVIAGNEVRDVGRNPDGTGSDPLAACIALIDNHGGQPLVRDNTVRNGAAFGIWDLTALGAAPPARIIANTIEECPTGIDTGSWKPPKSGTVIRSNRIRHSGSIGRGKACIRQFNAGACYIGSNELSGVFDEGIRVENGHGNLILWNDAAALTMPVKGAAFVLDEASCGNTIRARSGTVGASGACANEISIGE